MTSSILDFFVLLVRLFGLYINAFIKYVLPYEYLPKKELKGKKVLITGAGSGLGRRLAEKMAQKGAVLVLWDVNRKTVDELKDQLIAQKVQAHSYQVDLSNPTEIFETARKVKEELGKVDILVNNAGVATAKMILESSDEEIERSFAVNVKSHFYTVKQFLPEMLDQNEGHVVTIASAAGKMASAGLADYTSSKHAAVGFHDSLVAEIKNYGKDLKTTLVCPYYFHTSMFDATGASTRFPLLFPFLDPEYVTQKIMEAIETEQEYLVLPKVFYWVLPSAQILPYQAQKFVGEFFGLIQNLDRFHK